MTAPDHSGLADSIAAALEHLGWSAGDSAVREAVPTVLRGHNLVSVVPPAPVYATPILAALLSRLEAGKRALVLAPAAELREWGGQAHALAAGSGRRIEVAQGTARALRRLRGADVELLIAGPDTVLALHRRSALGLDELTGVLLAWPERWEAEHDLAPLMQDLRADCQRLVITADPGRAADVVERYARRALTLGDAGGPIEPAGPVRIVTVPWTRRAGAIADLIELLDPASLAVWTADRGHHEAIGRAIAAGAAGTHLGTGDAPGADLVIAFDPPTPARLRQLLAAGEVVLLAPAETLGYLERIAAPRRPLRLPGLTDQVTTSAGARRAAIVRALEATPPDRALLTLAPLFERYDPAAVAAALFELWTAGGAGGPAPMPDIAATARVYVGVGRKDGATVNDLVAILTKDVRVERGKIGRVELREGFALVEVPAQDAERVATALNGMTIRRKRVTARVDAGGKRPARPTRPARRS